jgi:hypothetical protein
MIHLKDGAPQQCERWFKKAMNTIDISWYNYHKPELIQPLFLGNWTIDWGRHPVGLKSPPTRQLKSDLTSGKFLANLSPCCSQT